MAFENSLINKIRQAFKDVKLEDGIGLWEAQGLDDYADNIQLKILRDKDERFDWTKISYEDIKLQQSSLFFIDAKGMQFLLPQFMLYEILEDTLQQYSNVTFTLTNNLESEYAKSRFALLNISQIEVIIDFLAFKLNNSNNDSDVNEINNGLIYWGKKLEKLDI